MLEDAGLVGLRQARKVVRDTRGLAAILAALIVVTVLAVVWFVAHAGGAAGRLI